MNSKKKKKKETPSAETEQGFAGPHWHLDVRVVGLQHSVQWGEPGLQGALQVHPAPAPAHAFSRRCLGAPEPRAVSVLASFL